MSLILYYTGSSKFGGIQNNKNKSLGGLISSSPVPNGFIGNIFGDVSRFTVMQDRSEIRVIAIKNIDTVTKTGLKAYFTYPNDGALTPNDTNDCVFKIGYIAPTADNCGDLRSEALVNIYANPYTVTLVDAVGLAGALSLPDLPANGYLCIYIKRIIKDSVKQPLPIDKLKAIADGDLVLPTLEDISLTFQWN